MTILHEGTVGPIFVFFSITESLTVEFVTRTPIHLIILF